MIHHVKRQVASYKYAARGIHYTLKTQVNIWIQLTVTVIVLALAYWLNFNPEQYLILVLTIGFVVVSELFNTALEALTDLLSPERQTQAGVVKDVAAGAVLVAAASAAIVGVVLFLPPLLLKFS
jgi:diacylglycerol kinase